MPKQYLSWALRLLPIHWLLRFLCDRAQSKFQLKRVTHQAKETGFLPNLLVTTKDFRKKPGF